MNGPTWSEAIRICDVAKQACFDSCDNTFRFCECGTIGITTDSLSSSMEDYPYEDTVEATGGYLSHSCSVISGHLPDGADEVMIQVTKLPSD